MKNFLEFKPAKCKDCYKCLKNCPVVAIEVVNHQAKIISSRCILCGTCTMVCPQDAKKVHNSIEEVQSLLDAKEKVIVSVAPSFVSSFGLKKFGTMRQALLKLGFYDAEETAIGAYAVTREYEKLLESNIYKNFITSACPAINKMIQLYYHDALPYLAPVVSPMVAHAKIIKAKNPDLKIVFVGPCIAKKQEAEESKIIDGALTFEELNIMLNEHNINFDESEESNNKVSGIVNKAKYYPISRGIIKSLSKQENEYEYVAVDGVKKCQEVLANINDFAHMFLELNSCEHACVNGPCSLIKQGTAVNANQKIRRYVHYNIKDGGIDQILIPEGIDFSYSFKAINPIERNPGDEEIKAILAKTGKLDIKDELNCGACGYDTCRKKAWAVANGYADIEMCVPYMRKKAESMSYEIIQHMPNGIVVIDNNYQIKEINSNASSMLLISPKDAKGMYIYELMDSSAFVDAIEKKKNTYHQKIFIDKTNTIAEISVISLKEEHSAFAVIKDVTEKTKAQEKYDQLRQNTIDITNEVINKQMRVAQEIASVLGETVAETKVAILNLKKSLIEDKKNDEDK